VTNKELTVYLRHGQIAVAMDLEVKYDSTTDIGSINRYVLSGDLLAGKITRTIKLDNSIVTKKEWYHLDHLNSTKATTDEAGKMSTMYEYRAFGEELKKLGSGDAKYKFQGKELDEETNLMYFNARYYDQTIGRFINVDPIQSGENWYVAFGNNPLNKVDPTGLFHFGIRPMDFTDKKWVFPLTNNPIDNTTNTELVHEHGFFDDGSGKNVGFGWTGRFSENSDGKNYKMIPKMYDDNLMKKALGNVKDGTYSLLGEKVGNKLNGLLEKLGMKPLSDAKIGKGEKNNCQDWADRLRKEYNNLYKKLDKDEQKRISAELKIKNEEFKGSLKKEKK